MARSEFKPGEWDAVSELLLAAEWLIFAASTQSDPRGKITQNAMRELHEACLKLRSVDEPKAQG